MPCNHKCSLWKAKRPSNGTRYESGQVFCGTCQIFMYPTKETTHNAKTKEPDNNPEHGLSCNCCNMRVSGRSYSSKYSKYQNPNKPKAFEELENYFQIQIQPQANYQYVIVKTLLENNGSCNVDKIREELKFYNEEQTNIDFEVGLETLLKHELIVFEDDVIELNLKESPISPERQLLLISLCNRYIYQKLDPKNVQHFTAVGGYDNWKHTIANPPFQWAITTTNQSNVAVWELAKQNDLAYYYPTQDNSPYTKRGFFGVGVIKKKLIDDSLYWPDEILENKSKYPNKIILDTIHIVFDEKNLVEVPKNTTLPFVKGFNRIADEKNKEELFSKTVQQWDLFSEIDSKKLQDSKSSSKNNLDELIEKFDKNRNYFNPNRETEDERNRIRDEFVARFSLDKLKTMKITEYVQGRKDPLTGEPDRTTFSYMLERGIPGFGGIGGTPAIKFGIYWHDKSNQYLYKGDFDSPEAAFEAVRNDVVKIIESGNEFVRDRDLEKLSDAIDDKSEHLLTSHVRSKILALYFPKHCLDIHSRPKVIQLLDYFGIDRTEIGDRLTVMQSKLLEVKHQYPIMNRWSIQDYSYLLWHGIIEDNEEDIDDIDEVLEDAGNYYIITQNEGSRYDDIPGIQYGYDSDKAHYKNFVKGTNFIVQSKIDNQNYFVGYGKVGKLEKTSVINEKGKNITKVIAKFSEYTEFPKKKIRTDKINKKMLDFAFPNGTPNIPPAMLPIDKDLYNEIRHGKFNLKPFENTKLVFPPNLNEAKNEIQKQLLIPGDVIDRIIFSLYSGKHVILTGPVGTGKTHLAQLIPKIAWLKIGGYYPETVTATSEWTTQDVIGGIFPKINGDEVKYSIQKGCVSDTISKNWLDNSGKSEKRIKFEKEGVEYNGIWLVIDEFNRANIDRAFGPLFTAFEYKKLKIPTTKIDESFEELTIPEDYRIIGTLNTFDKHFLFKLSDALKRRFSFIEILPPTYDKILEEIKFVSEKALENYDEVKQELKIQNFDDLRKNPEVYSLLTNLYEIMAFVRFSKNLGTAVLISMFRFTLINYLQTKNPDNSLDAAVLTHLLPHLESLQYWQIDSIMNFVGGRIHEMFRKFDVNKRPDVDRYEEEFRNLTRYLRISGTNKSAGNWIAKFRTGEIFKSPIPISDLDPWNNKKRPILQRFRESLEGLKKEKGYFEEFEGLDE